MPHHVSTAGRKHALNMKLFLWLSFFVKNL